MHHGGLARVAEHDSASETARRASTEQVALVCVGRWAGEAELTDQARADETGEASADRDLTARGAHVVAEVGWRSLGGAEDRLRLTTDRELERATMRGRRRHRGRQCGDRMLERRRLHRGRSAARREADQTRERERARDDQIAAGHVVRPRASSVTTARLRTNCWPPAWTVTVSSRVSSPGVTSTRSQLTRCDDVAPSISMRMS